MTPFPANRWAAIGVVLLRHRRYYRADRLHRASLQPNDFGRGWKVAPAEAAQFESELVRDPKNLALRVRLLRLPLSAHDRAARLRHVAWLIENRPDADVFLAASEISPTCPLIGQVSIKRPATNR